MKSQRSHSTTHPLPLLPSHLLTSTSLWSFLILLFLFSTTARADLFPKVVDHVDLAAYQGLWYEVASTKPKFEQDCVCTTAHYELLDESVKVTNQCRIKRIDGELDSVIGRAVPTRNPAKLKVSFGGFQFPFSNYWIVDLAEDYRYAVVSSAFRSPIFILSRTPDIDPNDLNAIYERLQADRFDVSRIQPTMQVGCW